MWVSGIRNQSRMENMDTVSVAGELPNAVYNMHILFGFLKNLTANDNHCHLICKHLDIFNSDRVTFVIHWHMFGKWFYENSTTY